MAKKDKVEIPPKITLKEILNKLGVQEKQINKLTEQLLKATFFDNYTKYEETDKDHIKLTGKNIITGEDNYIIINLKDSTLEYHEITNGINRIRRYTSGGFDLSLINQL